MSNHARRRPVRAAWLNDDGWAKPNRFDGLREMVRRGWSKPGWWPRG